MMVRTGRWMGACILVSSVSAAQTDTAQPRPAASTSGTDTAEAEARFAQGRRVLDEEENTEENVERALRLLDEAIRAGLPPARRAQAHADRALAFLRMGDLVRGNNKSRGLGFYEKGQAEGDKGIAADPRCADAHFYRGSNLGRWAETRGVFQSMFALGDIKAAFARTLQLDPEHLEAQLARAMMDERLPGIAGGDSQRAERTYRSLLKKYPHYTRGMLEFADFLEGDGRREEARQWLGAVVAEREPMKPADHQRFDLPRAQETLARWKKK